MTNFSNISHVASGRIDTTITLTEVVGVEGWKHRAAAAHYVEENFADEQPRVLGVWRTHDRGPHGAAVWAVEWTTPEEETP